MTKNIDVEIGRNELIVGTFYTGRQLALLGFNAVSACKGRKPEELSDRRDFPRLLVNNNKGHYILRPIVDGYSSNWDEVWFAVEKRYDWFHDYRRLFKGREDTS